MKHNKWTKPHVDTALLNKNLAKVVVVVTATQCATFFGNEKSENKNDSIFHGV